MTGAFSIFFFVYAWFTNKLKKRSRCLDLHKHHQEKKWRMRKRRIGVKRKTYLKIGCIDQCVHWTSVYILTPFPLPPPPHGPNSPRWFIKMLTGETFLFVCVSDVQEVCLHTWGISSPRSSSHRPGWSSRLSRSPPHRRSQTSWFALASSGSSPVGRKYCFINIYLIIIFVIIKYSFYVIIFIIK